MSEHDIITWVKAALVPDVWCPWSRISHPPDNPSTSMTFPKFRRRDPTLSNIRRILRVGWPCDVDGEESSERRTIFIMDGPTCRYRSKLVMYLSYGQLSIFYTSRVCVASIEISSNLYRQLPFTSHSMEPFLPFELHQTSDGIELCHMLDRKRGGADVYIGSVWARFPFQLYTTMAGAKIRMS
jgi:hypothetical protein